MSILIPSIYYWNKLFFLFEQCKLCRKVVDWKKFEGVKKIHIQILRWKIRHANEMESAESRKMNARWKTFFFHVLPHGKIKSHIRKLEFYLQTMFESSAAALRETDFNFWLTWENCFSIYEFRFTCHSGTPSNFFLVLVQMIMRFQTVSTFQFNIPPSPVSAF